MECVGKLRVPMGKGKLFSSVGCAKMWIISYMNDGRQLLSFVIMNYGRLPSLLITKDSSCPIAPQTNNNAKQIARFISAINIAIVA